METEEGFLILVTFAKQWALRGHYALSGTQVLVP